VAPATVVPGSVLECEADRIVLVKQADQPRLSVHVILRVSFVANVPLPVEKLAICGIVPTDAALNVADANTDVNAPDAVNVCSIVVLFVPALWVFVVASARASPLVEISPVSVVFAAAGVIDDSVDAI
jgi:hypothetical protein